MPEVCDCDCEYCDCGLLATRSAQLRYMEVEDDLDELNHQQLALHVSTAGAEVQ